MLALLTAARDGNRLGMRIDAVLDKLRDGLQRIALRKGDNADRVPIVGDPQFAALRGVQFDVLFHHSGTRLVGWASLVA